MTRTDLDALEALAKPATPGTRTAVNGHTHLVGLNQENAWWSVHVGGDVLVREMGNNGNKAADARFIAACDRETVLALIALARRTEEAEDSDRESLAMYRSARVRAEEAEAERDAARAALATVGCSLNDCIIQGRCMQPERCSACPPMTAGAGRPLSAEHREALRRLLAEEERRRAAAQHAQIRHYHDEHIAVLQAALGGEQLR